jgi:TatD DNase family protein
MNLPQAGDYIDIHTHGADFSEGVFAIRNLMAHEGVSPDDINGMSCSFGIHPWFLDENNFQQQISLVRSAAQINAVIAIGEAGFDRLKGPAPDLQRKAFEEQILISELNKKPLFIHCVRAWDELLASHKKLKPEMPWMVHGFRGNKELAAQLTGRGMYISFWYDFVIRPESSQLIKSISTGRIFLETDGADIDIRDIYNKVCCDLKMTPEELKSLLYSNFITFFNL